MPTPRPHRPTMSTEMIHATARALADLVESNENSGTDSEPELLEAEEVFRLFSFKLQLGMNKGATVKPRISIPDGMQVAGRKGNPISDQGITNKSLAFELTPESLEEQEEKLFAAIQKMEQDRADGKFIPNPELNDFMNAQNEKDWESIKAQQKHVEEAKAKPLDPELQKFLDSRGIKRR